MPSRGQIRVYSSSREKNCVPAKWAAQRAAHLFPTPARSVTEDSRFPSDLQAQPAFPIALRASFPEHRLRHLKPLTGHAGSRNAPPRLSYLRSGRSCHSPPLRHSHSKHFAIQGIFALRQRVPPITSGYTHRSRCCRCILPPAASGLDRRAEFQRLWPVFRARSGFNVYLLKSNNTSDMFTINPRADSVVCSTWFNCSLSRSRIRSAC